MIKEGDQVTLRPRGKDGVAFFDAESRGTLPPRPPTAARRARRYLLMFMLDADMCIYLVNERDEALRARFEANAAHVAISSLGERLADSAA